MTSKTKRGSAAFDGVYLIKSYFLKSSEVYKVFLKGEDIYFCKVGGQNYVIGESEGEYNPEAEEDVLLKGQHNFKIPKKDISSIEVNYNKSMLVGDSNHGVIIFTLNDKKVRFVIHSKQNKTAAYDYFQRICELPSAVIKDNSKEYKPAEYRIVRKIIIALNVLATLAFFMAFNRNTFILSVIINSILPVIGIYIYVRFSVFTKLIENKGKRKLKIKALSTAYLILIPTLSLNIQFSFYNVYTQNIWIFLIAITLSIYSLLIVKNKRYISLLLVIAIFGYLHGFMMSTNRIFANSQYETFSSHVEDKKIKTSRGSDSYFLVAEPWGPIHESKDISVQKSRFFNTKIGDEVEFTLRSGLWGIQWYELK